MTSTQLLPAIDWPTLLQRAPHFSSALIDTICDEQPSKFPPHIRAVYYYDLFDAQVSNGGVDQYFSNLALCVPNFARAPEFIAHNAAFGRALPMIEEVHAIWNDIASAYIAASEEDEDEDEDEHEDEPDAFEALLAPYTERIEAIAQAFFAIHHEIRQGLEADIVRDPHRYFTVEAVPGLHGKGVEHLTLNHGTDRLRFEDGFPIGPNILEREGGGCDVVWFSRDRTLLHAETAGFLESRIRQWIHYPSQASGNWSFNFAQDGRSVRNDLQSLGLATHGLREYFHENGRRQDSASYWHGEELCSESFYPEGTVQLRRRKRDDGSEHWLRYWPGGALNTECIEDGEGRSRYLRCLDPEGRDLAPNGTGRLHEMLSLDDGMRQWREGELVDGHLSGPVLRMASLPDGSKARETERTFFKKGRAR